MTGQIGDISTLCVCGQLINNQLEKILLVWHLLLMMEGTWETLLSRFESRSVGVVGGVCYFIWMPMLHRRGLSEVTVTSFLSWLGSWGSYVLDVLTSFPNSSTWLSADRQTKRRMRALAPYQRRSGMWYRDQIKKGAPWWIRVSRTSRQLWAGSFGLLTPQTKTEPKWVCHSY